MPAPQYSGQRRVLSVFSPIGSSADELRETLVDVALPPAQSGSRPEHRSSREDHSPACCEYPLVDIGLARGEIEQRIVRWIPGQSAPLHHTHSVDVDVVLSGSIDLVLRDAVVSLTQGDVLTVDGVVHGWTAGPQGCVLSVTLIAG